MGKFGHALGLGSFSGSKQQQQNSSSSRPPSACASPISTAPASAPQIGPLTLGHQVAAKEQLLPHMVADVVTEEADKIPAMPGTAVVSRLGPSDNGKRHDLHGPLPQAQLQYSNLAGKMLRMVNELRATGVLAAASVTSWDAARQVVKG